MNFVQKKKSIYSQKEKKNPGKIKMFAVVIPEWQDYG